MNLICDDGGSRLILEVILAYFLLMCQSFEIIRIIGWHDIFNILQYHFFNLN